MKKKILVVDDELLLRDVMYDYLIRKGYDVYLASDGFKALEIAKKNKFDLALIDIKMPKMSGLELTKKLKEKYPNRNIIIMTGYPSLNTAVTAIKNGANEYIVKPFRLEELNKIIKMNINADELKKENSKLKEKIKDLENKIKGKNGINKNKGNEIKSEKKKNNKELEKDLRPHKRYFESTQKDEKEAKKIYKTISENKKQLKKNLKKLEELYNSDLISEKEFLKKKKELLKK